MDDVQKQLNAMMSTINSNPKVVAFLQSPVGQYLDGRPFIALCLLVFVAMSALPVGVFLAFAVITAVIACVGFIVAEGLVLSVGGLVLLCALCGLAIIAFVISAVLSLCYIAVSSVINYYHPSTPSEKQGNNGNPSQPDTVSAATLDSSANKHKGE